MTESLDQRRRTHLHGVIAGSLLVLALFLAVAVPSAAAMLWAGQAVASSASTLAVFLAFVAGAILEARAWVHAGPPQSF